MYAIFQKRCSGCKLTLSSILFDKNKSTVDGVQRYCKQCRADKHKAYKNANPFTPLWRSIKGRCETTSSGNYRLYGGRGIRCLISSPEELSNILGPKLGNNYSVDRIDPNGHYEEGNIRWATKKEQANNKRIKNKLTEEQRNSIRGLEGNASAIGRKYGIAGSYAWQLQKGFR